MKTIVFILQMLRKCWHQRKGIIIELKKKSEIEQFKKYEQLDKKKVFRAQNNVIMDQFTNETVISLNIFLSFFILIKP